MRLRQRLAGTISRSADQPRAARGSGVRHETGHWVGRGLSSAAGTGGIAAGVRTRPEPPSNTPTARACLVARTTNMTFSFEVRRGTPAPGGEHGSPFGMP